MIYRTAIALLISVTGCDLNPDAHPGAPTPKGWERTADILESDPTVGKVRFIFPQEIAHESVRVYLNGIVIDPTYCGEIWIPHPEVIAEWYYDQAVSDDVTTGIIVVDPGQVFEFSIPIDSMVYRMWHISLYRDEQGTMRLYSATGSRTGVI